MENNLSNCLLCHKEAKKHKAIGKSHYLIDCQTCGKYTHSSFREKRFESMAKDDSAMLSAYTRELYEYDSLVPNLDVLDEENQIEKIIERYKAKSLNDKFDNFIQYVAKKTTDFGEEIKIDFKYDYPITYSKSGKEFENIFYACRDLHFIKAYDIHSSEQPLTLTLEGWKKSEEIRSKGALSKNCFVAMSCAEDLSDIYEKGIKVTVEEAGYKPIFIEREEHNEKICDLIIAEILASKFLIADVTGQRQNVYYEAGFAQGLNKEVIWTCRSDEKEIVHFDTRQYAHIFWDDTEDLKKKLVARIKATIL